MRGLIVTGPLRSGKTTIQRTLVLEHGFWTPVTYTTRSVEPDEDFLQKTDWEMFRANVIQGSLVFPAKFGDYWYAWKNQDLKRLRTPGCGLAVVNVRTYTALVLNAVVQELIPVWLWTDKAELQRRRSSRRAERDTDSSIESERQAQDLHDRLFEHLFERRVKSDHRLVESLLGLLGS